MIKTYNEAYELMQKLALNHHQMMYDKTTRKNVIGFIQTDVFNALSVQMAALIKQMQKLENKT